MINSSGPLEFTMHVLNYDLLGFKISASDFEMNATTRQVMMIAVKSKKQELISNHAG
jgi:hypothetical protein